MSSVHVDGQIVVAVLCVGALLLLVGAGLVSDWILKRREAREEAMEKTREQLERENQRMRSLLLRIREEDLRMDSRSGSGFWTEDIDEAVYGDEELVGGEG